MGSLILVRHSITAASADGRNLGQRTDLPALRMPGCARRAPRAGARRGARGAAARRDARCSAARPCAAGRRPRPSRPRSSSMPTRIEVEAGPDRDRLRRVGRAQRPTSAARRDPELRAAWEADPVHHPLPRTARAGRTSRARAFAVLDAVEAWLAADRARCGIVVAHNHVNRLRLCALLRLADARVSATGCPRIRAPTASSASAAARRSFGA